MPHDKKKGWDYDYGAGPGGGLGNMHGQIGSPQDPCPYDITPNGGKSDKGGEPSGPFGAHKETANQMMGVDRDSMSATPTIQGGISTPMDTSTASMPGVSGSSGTGPTGGAKISSPFSSPWGDSVG